MQSSRKWLDSKPRRLIDASVAGLGLLVCAPILLIAGVLLWLEHGPALFRQSRRGYEGELFTLVKLRTMSVNRAPTPDVAIKDGSAAITPVGRWLRRLKVDEVPQLLNVLRGEMSLIGPRPLPPEVEQLIPRELRTRRRATRPGITGLAQVRLGRTAPWDVRARLDVEYIETASPWVDARILAMTVVRLFSPLDRV